MAIDQQLAARVRQALADERVAEKKMMGGLCFMVDGHMCGGVDKDRLILRVGADAYERTLKLKHVREMDITGKPLRGFVIVQSAGVKTQRAVNSWIRRALDFVRTLPAR